ncbi:MAG: class I SAM-dependent methyltransferase, partial [Acidobacteriales bacterium]|nr:class I SAM-dependent methyltransferase [Terriglobales bacterium]
MNNDARSGPAVLDKTAAASGREGVWLNMGGGSERLPGWKSVDLHSEHPDLRIDLFKLPWPFASESVDGIAMFHFLEHVPDLEATILEVHR